jgi:hypothetical protein
VISLLHNCPLVKDQDLVAIFDSRQPKYTYGFLSFKLKPFCFIGDICVIYF